MTTDLGGPITSGFEDDERWWELTLSERRYKHVLEDGDTLDCSWPECAWHGMLPGEQNEKHPSSPP